MKDDLKVALLFGGVSSEHDISCMSAQTFLSAMEEDKKYTVYPIYISRTGEWFLYEGDRTKLILAPDEVYTTPVAVLPGLGRDAFLLLDDEGTQEYNCRCGDPGTTWIEWRRRDGSGPFGNGPGAICRVWCACLCAGYG